MARPSKLWIGGSLDLYHHVQDRVALHRSVARHHLPSRRAVSLRLRDVVSQPPQGDASLFLLPLPAFITTPSEEATTISPVMDRLLPHGAPAIVITKTTCPSSTCV